MENDELAVKPTHLQPPESCSLRAAFSTNPSRTKIVYSLCLVGCQLSVLVQCFRFVCASSRLLVHSSAKRHHRSPAFVSQMNRLCFGFPASSTRRANAQRLFCFFLHPSLLGHPRKRNLGYMGDMRRSTFFTGHEWVKSQCQPRASEKPGHTNISSPCLPCSRQKHTIGHVNLRDVSICLGVTSIFVAAEAAETSCSSPNFAATYSTACTRALSRARTHTRPKTAAEAL